MQAAPQPESHHDTLLVAWVPNAAPLRVYRAIEVLTAEHLEPAMAREVRATARTHSRWFPACVVAVCSAIFSTSSSKLPLLRAELSPSMMKKSGNFPWRGSGMGLGSRAKGQPGQCRDGWSRRGGACGWCRSRSRRRQRNVAVDAILCDDTVSIEGRGRWARLTRRRCPPSAPPETPALA